MRLSELQGDILSTLAAFESLGHKDKVPAKVILNLINTDRESRDKAKIFGAALRKSLKTMHSNKLVRKFKSMENGELSFLLTEDGRAIGIECMVKKQLQDS